jgi:hypothetical protein
MPASKVSSSPPAEAAAQTGIVWLASYPKSGNTWTRTFLHNLLGQLDGDDTEHDINEINEFTTWDLASRRYEPHLKDKIPSGKTVQDLDRAEIAAVRPLVQAEIAAQTDGLALVKTHHALMMDRGHPTLNFQVTSGAVYLVRNPLDVAVSYSHHLNTDIDHAILQMETQGLETPMAERSVYEVYGSWSEHVASWTAKPHRAICVLRYEDMLADPREAFSKLANHLLLHPTPTQLDIAIARSSFEKLKAQEEKNGFREKPEFAKQFFRKGEAGEWRETLTRRQVRRIVKAHAAQMERFGYLTDDLRHLAR